MAEIERTMRIKNKLGLHARAATKLVTLANDYEAQVMIRHGERSASAASVMGLMLLETCQGEEIQVTADGKDAEAAICAIERLIDSRFEEAE